MSCDKGCFEANISSCNDIIVRAAFTPNFPMYWVINKAGSNNIYQKLTQTNTDGDLIISEDDLPAGFLVPGKFIEIKVKDGNNYLQSILFEFGGVTFDCIMVKLTNVIKPESDGSDVNVIQFTEATVPENTGISFVADGPFTIELKEGDVLEYVTLSNTDSMDVTIGTTEDGSEIATATISTLQSITINYPAPSDMSIYVGGILPGTKVKFKKS